MPSAAVKPSVTLPEIALPEISLPSTLPDDVVGLAALLHAQQSAYAEAVETIRRQAMGAAHDYLIRMVEQAALARHRLYGASSEQLSPQAHCFICNKLTVGIKLNLEYEIVSPYSLKLPHEDNCVFEVNNASGNCPVSFHLCAGGGVWLRDCRVLPVAKDTS